MYIGADTACSIQTENGYKRVSGNMPKLFSLGQSVFFCSGRKSDAEKCVSWIYDNFKTEIDIEKLESYLKDVFTVVNKDNVFNLEFLLCDYKNHKVVQLSQYNNFNPMIYNCSDELRILCGGYKTKDSFLMAKKNLILNKSVGEIYKYVFESISDECVGGKVVLYNSPASFEIISIEESNIKYVNNGGELFLLTSDFVTSGVVNGSQIIGGDIYSTNYVPNQSGTYLGLNDGSFSFGGGKFAYNNSTNKMTLKGVDIEWASSTTPEITDIDGLSDDLSTIKKDISTAQSSANKAQSSADNAQTTADGAKSVADNAKTIGDNLVSGLGFTKISGSYVISPVIAGGTLLIGDTSGTYAQITEDGILNCKGANIEGAVTATSLTLGSNVKIPYGSVSDTPNLNVYIQKDGTLGTLPSSGATSSTSTGFKVSTNGLLTASNAVIYGTIYATNGSFSGEVKATSGSITGNLSIGGSLTHTSGNYSVTLRGVQSNLGNGVFFITDKSSGTATYPLNITGDGSLYAQKLYATGGIIGGCSITNGKLIVPSANIDGTITATAVNAATGTLGTVTATDLTVTGGKITLGDATLSSTGLTVVGTGSSKLGCVSVDKNSLFIGSWGGSSRKTPSVFMCSGSSTSQSLGGSGSINGWAFGAGSNFGVTNTGAVYCNNMNVNGGKIVINGSSSTDARLKISYTNANTYTQVSPGGITVYASGVSTIISGGAITTAGEKPRMVTTEHYDTRMLYCYETPTPMFGDIGEGKLDETGICYVYIDDIFSETIDLNYTYQVFLQKYGDGDCYVVERNSMYFIVKGTPNMSFGWELKTAQFDAANKRLEYKEVSLGSIFDNECTTASENDFDNYIDSLLESEE